MSSSPYAEYIEGWKARWREEEVRPAVISPDLATELDELRKFRHFVRHAYGAVLEWPKVHAQLERIGQVHPFSRLNCNSSLLFCRK